MSVEERLERLEKRVIAMEGVVRALAAGRGETVRRSDGPTVGGPAPAAPPPALGPGARPSPPNPPPVRPSSRLPDFTEQWIGQRALLAIGVFAL
ncbi:MAG: hypothetical protein H0V43_05490, partial [Gemmatimonadales bacterium]|nr:hypothetical protein [Gemmatimonadales bacterium]